MEELGTSCESFRTYNEQLIRELSNTPKRGNRLPSKGPNEDYQDASGAYPSENMDGSPGSELLLKSFRQPIKSGLEIVEVHVQFRLFGPTPGRWSPVPAS